MTSAVVSNRKHKPERRVRAVAFAGRRADRALDASHLPLADARAMGRSSRPTSGCRVEPGHDGKEEGGSPCFLQTNGTFASPHHIWWSPAADWEAGGRGGDFRENHSKAILSRDQRLKGGRANAGRHPPHPNPLQKGRGRATGVPPTQFSEVRMGTFEAGGGGKRGFSQNKYMWTLGRRVRDVEARRPEDACPRAGSSYISARSPSAQKDL
jgi:hypothetical protein